MRRKDREVTDKSEIVQIIKDSHCCRIGFCDDGHVYIVPLSFGEVIKDDSVILYFHSAKDGRKIDLIQRNPHVGFEMDTNYQIKEANVACDFSAKYQSIIGEGKVKIVEVYDEKIIGLDAIMKHSTEKTWSYKEEMVDEVCIFKLMVETISCKQII